MEIVRIQNNLGKSNSYYAVLSWKNINYFIYEQNFMKNKKNGLNWVSF